MTGAERPLAPDWPEVASKRAVLRNGLPAIYRGDDLSMRFIGALEALLDPAMVVMDALPQHFDPDLAPPEVLSLIASWLGFTLDESWPEERKREVVRRAGRLLRLRGTRAGVELALEIIFPDLPLRIVESGGVTIAPDVASLPPASAPEFVVYCDVPLEHPGAVVRVIEQMKPAHVAFRLKLKRPGEPDA